ncbi:MAG: ferredoxin [Candidatus Levybacteria bacterium CG10_big_fil_rev_8_21_14_0_10_36_7]|nr:MAG: ferredoxin [Candidatus Levybacteria bacterium CG10_big_fil_rev_8_21_14_0_10_36_7]
MAKIIQDQDTCIGCGSCEAVCSKFWKMDYDIGKAVLVGGKKNEARMFELEVADGECNNEAADVCPVGVITVIQE